MTNRSARVIVSMGVMLALLPATRVWGWVDTGHKLVAMIAWDELTPAARAKATEILKHHPQYERDLVAGVSGGSDEPTTARHAFAIASTWPDLVKAQSHPMHFAANHPDWHYIDLPYRPDGEPSPPTTAPSEGNTPGPHDVVEALKLNSELMRDSSAAATDRAIALCWVLHLGGDIHQPLHTITLVSKQFPNGDKGGNAFLVLRDPPFFNSQMNLHLIWDQLPGNFKSDPAIAYLAAGVRADPNLSRERMKDALAVKDFAAWARESHELAVQYAYVNGTLAGAVAARGGQPDPGTQVPGLPPGYLERAERIAFRRVALAGHRTADLINVALDPNPPAGAR